MNTNKTNLTVESNVDSTNQTEYKESVIPKGFNSTQLYSSTQMTKSGCVICFLKANRDENTRVTSDKIRSIKSIGAVVSPLTVVSARAALEQGLEIVDKDRNKITLETPNIDRYITLVDGFHRYTAIKRINKGHKEGEVWYELYFHFPPIEYCNIACLLRELNVSTAAWKSKDFLSSILMTKASDEDPYKLEKLQWIKDTYSKCPERTTWIWASLNSDKTPPTKSAICKAEKDDKALDNLAKKGQFEYGKRIFDCFDKKYESNFIGMIEVAKFFADKVNNDIARNIPIVTAVDKYCDFIDRITERSAKIAISHKGGAGRESRVDMILRTLKEELNSYEMRVATQAQSEEESCTLA